MNKESLILMTSIGLVGYITFHGHRTGQDCWLCPYKGLVFAGGFIALGIYAAITDK